MSHVCNSYIDGEHVGSFTINNSEDYNEMKEKTILPYANGQIGHYDPYGKYTGKDGEDVISFADVVPDEDIMNNIFGKHNNSKIHREYTDDERSRIKKGEWATVILLCIAIYSTVNNGVWQYQLMLYLLSLSALLLTDAFEIVGMFLSKQVRYMYAVCFTTIGISTFINSQNAYILAVVAFVIASVCWKLKNQFWLNNENFLYTEEGQRVLNGDYGEFVIKTWKKVGKPEVNTTLSKLGRQIDFRVLDGFLMPVYCLGLIRGLMNLEQTAQDKEECRRLKEENKSLKIQNKQLENRIYVLEKESEEKDDDLLSYIKSDAKLSKRNRELEEENNLLKQIENEEIEIIEKPVAKTYYELNELEKEQLEEEVKSFLLSSQGSIRKAVSEFGIPYARVATISKELKQKVVAISA